MDRRCTALALAALGIAVLPVAGRGRGPGATARERPAAEDRIGPGWGSVNGGLVLVGPAADPARVSGLRDTAEALRRIAEAGAPFVSCGDRGGTHEAELRLWRAARVEPERGRGRWYREMNRGVGATLEAAAAQDAYALTDRNSWFALRDRRNLRIVVEGDRRSSE